MYLYGLFVAIFLITGTVLVAMGDNAVREWWRRRAPRQMQAAPPAVKAQPAPPAKSGWLWKMHAPFTTRVLVEPSSTSSTPLRLPFL